MGKILDLDAKRKKKLFVSIAERIDRATRTAMQLDYDKAMGVRKFGVYDPYAVFDVSPAQLEAEGWFPPPPKKA